MKITSLIAAFIFFAISANLTAQPIDNFSNPDTISTANIFWQDIQTGMRDAVSFVSAPYQWKSNDWLKAAVAAGLTASLFTADREIRNSSLKNRTDFLDKNLKIGDWYGNGIYAGIFAVTAYSTGLIFKNYELRTTGKILAESLIAAGISVQVIKILFGRSRPYTGDGPHKFNFINFNNDFNSFTSGHTIIAFTTSTVLAERIDNIFASIGLYGLAALTAYQRVYSDNHWFSDTFMSALLGIAIGEFFININDAAQTDDSKISLKISPGLSRSGPGINLHLSF